MARNHEQVMLLLVQSVLKDTLREGRQVHPSDQWYQSSAREQIQAAMTHQQNWMDGEWDGDELEHALIRIAMALYITYRQSEPLSPETQEVLSLVKGEISDERRQQNERIRQWIHSEKLPGRK